LNILFNKLAYLVAKNIPQNLTSSLSAAGMGSSCREGVDLGPDAGDDGPVGDLVFGEDIKNYRNATLNQSQSERYF
jgi:hypothetical protein